eukprot:759438-Hanusia_phi.AAC.8
MPARPRHPAGIIRAGRARSPEPGIDAAGPTIVTGHCPLEQGSSLSTSLTAVEQGVWRGGGRKCAVYAAVAREWGEEDARRKVNLYYSIAGQLYLHFLMIEDGHNVRKLNRMDPQMHGKSEWFIHNCFVKPSTTVNNFCYPIPSQQQAISQFFNAGYVPAQATNALIFSPHVAGSCGAVLNQPCQPLYNQKFPLSCPLPFVRIHSGEVSQLPSARVTEAPRVVQAYHSPSNLTNQRRSLTMLAHQLKIATQEDLHDRIEQFRLTYAFLTREGASEQDRQDAVRMVCFFPNCNDSDPAKTAQQNGGSRRTLERLKLAWICRRI